MSDDVWRSLDPYRPLRSGDPRYVQRPAGQGYDLAAAVRSGLGGGRIGLSGPAGVGKSTELRAAGARLAAERFVVQLDVDQLTDIRSLSDHTLLVSLGIALGDASDNRRRVEQFFRQVGGAGADVLASSVGLGGWMRTLVQESENRTASLREKMDAIDLLLRDVARGRRVCFLVDGMEKAPLGGQEAVGTLCDVAERAGAELIVVLAPGAVFGPSASEIIQRLKLVNLPAVIVEGPGAMEGLSFLVALAEHRGVSVDRTVVGLAAIYSGGIPRMFLQLLQDASGYARLEGREDPTLEDVEEAARDQADGLRALLTAGDLYALQRVRNTAGTELDAVDRARYLTQGFLLARGRGDSFRLEVHPLLARLVERGGA